MKGENGKNGQYKYTYSGNESQCYYSCPDDCNYIIRKYDCFKYVSHGKPGQKGGNAGIGGFDGINGYPGFLFMRRIFFDKNIHYLNERIIIQEGNTGIDGLGRNNGIQNKKSKDGIPGLGGYEGDTAITYYIKPSFSIQLKDDIRIEHSDITSKTRAKGGTVGNKSILNKISKQHDAMRQSAINGLTAYKNKYFRLIYEIETDYLNFGTKNYNGADKQFLSRIINEFSVEPKLEIIQR